MNFLRHITPIALLLHNCSNWWLLQEHLATHKMPERILTLPELPKGATGKVNRKALKEIAVAQLVQAST